MLEALPDWFGIPELREEYIQESSGKIFFCAYKGEKPVGFLYLKQSSVCEKRGAEYNFVASFFEGFTMVGING